LAGFSLYKTIEGFGKMY